MTSPHADQPVLSAGADLSDAAGVVVLVHGRGASAGSILGLTREFDRPDLAYLAPQAAGGAWYPRSFLAPLDENEPFLTSAIDAVMRAVGHAEAAGLGRDQIVLGGFSQGACLATEVAVRHAHRWGGVFALSGGLLGSGPGRTDAPPLQGMGGSYPEKAFDYDGHLDGTPVFIGGSDVDPHIPLVRMKTTADVFERLGAEVDLRLYPNFGHTINLDEIEAVRAMLDRL